MNETHMTKKQSMENIVLIGFMGTGKSTIAQCLSKKLEMAVIDTDKRIEENENRRISEMFEQFGEGYFRDCESKLLASLEEARGVVISCGGGIVLREENRAYLKKIGRVVLLTATPETIYKRVKENHDRPLLNDAMGVAHIAEMLKKREMDYQAAADITVKTDGKNKFEIAEEILKELNSL